MKDLKTPFVSVLSTGIKPYTTGLFDGPLEIAKQLQNFKILHNSNTEGTEKRRKGLFSL
jgi:hypothetical protein